MIHEEICTYEVCKLAKEKGFPQQIDFGGYWYATKYYKNSCLGEYFEEERTQVEDYHDKSTTYYFIDECIALSAPTQSLLQRWLREEKGVVVIVYSYDNFYKWEVYNTAGATLWISDATDTATFSTYELALEDALKYALENLVQYELTEEQFNDACDRYRQILRETEGNWEERKRRINEFRCGEWL